MKKISSARLGFLAFLVAFILFPSAIFLSRVLYKPKVYDCFLFFNEFDILDIRLNEMNDQVDKFILVESTKGFSGKQKPLYFLENKERYAKFLPKIVHVVVDEFPKFSPIVGTDYWEIENFQRTQIMQGLKRCHPNKRDIVLISDVDEIIRSNKIPKIVKMIDRRGEDVVFGRFDVYYFFLNRKGSQTLTLAIATSWENLSIYFKSSQLFRNLSGFTKGHAFNGFEVLEAVKKQHPKKKWAFARINDIGWHFTSLGDFTKFQQKIKNYSHLTTDNEWNQNIENIKNQIRNFEYCEITSKFPKYVIDNEENLRSRGCIDEKETIFQ